MSGEVISFTTIKYSDVASMLKAREVLQQEMNQLAHKLRPLGMTKFHSSQLFLPEDRFDYWQLAGISRYGSLRGLR